MFVVADGMGGAQAGEVASQIAVEAFAQGLPDDGSAEERLVLRALEANRRIYELASAEHERAGMGTTLTAALLDDAHVAIAHVGDSRAYLFRDGELRRLTKDHSLVWELVERGKLTEEQAEEHPQRSIITRALGPEPTVDVDTWSYPVRDDDVLLLCSDGLTSMISEERISRILAIPGGLDEKADRLIADANEAGGRDNITVVLVRLEDVGVDSPGDSPTIVAERAVVTAAPPSTERATEPAVRAPLARTQGRPAVHGTNGRVGRERRFVKPVAALLATVIVLGLLGTGFYLATRQLYFIGTNPQGIVTIYRGLPYDLPAGLKLYETFYVSGVPAAELPADRRGTLFNHHLRSETDAENLVRSIELGQLTQ
jgi:protein phosphatase